MLSRKVATQLKQIETPFYLYDINLLRQTLESVVYESNKYNYKVQIFSKICTLRLRRVMDSNHRANYST